MHKSPEVHVGERPGWHIREGSGSGEWKGRPEPDSGAWWVTVKSLGYLESGKKPQGGCGKAEAR
jgi:hypothetical protein